MNTWPRLEASLVAEIGRYYWRLEDEAPDTPQLKPTRHRTAPTTKNGPAPNVQSGETEQLSVAVLPCSVQGLAKMLDE